jgi:hypothetical protein
MNDTIRFVPATVALLAGPAIWIAHFALVYATVALICARPATDGSGGGETLATATGLLTALAIALMAWVFRPATWRRSGVGRTARFLSWLRLALALISLCALAANALVALGIPECRG